MVPFGLTGVTGTVVVVPEAVVVDGAVVVDEDDGTFWTCRMWFALTTHATP